MIIFRLIKESVIFAYQALILNKLRSFLSLLGISIGIFSIIAVFTLVDTLEGGIRDGVNKLGDDVVFIQKWPWGGGPDFAWWEYWQRPHPRYREFRELQQKEVGAAAMCFQMDLNRSVSYEDKNLSRVQVDAVSEDYTRVQNLDIAYGRFLTDKEIRSGASSVIIGHELATLLFGDAETSLDKRIKVGNRKVTVIGVLEKSGSGISFNSQDNNVICSIQFARSIANRSRADNSILVKATEGVSIAELKDRLEGAFRAIRRIHPKEKSDFSMNESSMLNSSLDSFFGVVNIAGLVIGLFSILVGGFSIANIMFVSVKERTNLIGIQKSLGAKSYFVLLQFLFEAVFLSLAGGAVGIGIVFIGTVIASLALDMNALISIKNITLGLSISAIIGLISGLAPALQAARMNPVDAIRSN